jgi:hypothetical protein
MPKIVRFHQVGGPEVLRFDEQPSRQPGKGEVRLKVQGYRPEPGGIDVHARPIHRNTQAA